MSYYVIIRGPLGIGKTTIVKSLSKKLNATYISIDKILKNNNLDSFKNNSIPIENFVKANIIIIPKMKNLLEKGRIVILDGCFYHTKQIEHLKKNLKYTQYVFTLKAPLKLCIERDSERKISYGNESTKIVYKLTTKFDYGKNISIKNKNLENIIKEIISYLPIS